MIWRGKSVKLGLFRYYPETQRLYRGRRACPLTGRPLALLDLLVKNRGQCVARQEIEAALWPRARRVDTSFRLNTTVRSLRSHLGEKAGSPQLIETIRGRGYRLTCQQEPASWRIGGAVSLAIAVLILTTRSAALSPQPAEPEPGDLAAFAAANVLPDRPNNHLDKSEYWPAKVLRGKLAVERWQQNPSVASREAARRTIQEVALGQSRPEMAGLAGQFALYADWNWRDAENRLLTAVADGYGQVDSHRALMWLYLNSGRWDLAWSHLEVLLHQTPLSGAQLAEVGWVMLRLRRPELAREVCDQAGAHHVNGLSCLHTALARLDRLPEARQVALTVMQRLNAGNSPLKEVNHGEAEEGYQRFLEWRVTNLGVSENRLFRRAQLQAAAGQFDGAMESLKGALAQRDPLLIKLNTTYEFLPLRNRPAYQALVEQVYALL